MGKIKGEDERGKERLEERREEDEFTCSNCDNNTFFVQRTPVDFPFFELLCSKCGGINLFPN